MKPTAPIRQGFVFLVKVRLSVFLDFCEQWFFFFFFFFFPPLWMRPMTALCDVLHKCQIPEQDWHSGIQVIYTPNIFILYCIISLNWKFHVWKIFCCCIYKHRFEIIDGIDFNKRKTKFQTFTLPVDTHLMNLIWKGLLNAVISLTVF